MTEFDQDDVNAKNDESLRMLARSLTLSQGQFSLILARCNYRSLQERLMQQLRERCPVEFRERVLDPSAKTLETTIQEELGDEPPTAVIISGLESVRDLDAVLIATNQARDEFRKNFLFPLVLWVTDEVLQKLIRVAPDFKSWAAAPIEFMVTTDELINFIQQTTDEVFAKVLDAGASIFVDNTVLNLGIDTPCRTELESAKHELQSRGVKPDPQLEASLEFVLGRDADSLRSQSRQHYEQNLALWSQSSNLERRGCVLYSLGLWWRTYAEKHRVEHDHACGRAKDYFQQCVMLFEQTERPELAAKFISALEEVLQRLKQWKDLESTANKALAFHENYPEPFRLAQTHGFMAEVALAKSAWTEAEKWANTAIDFLKSPQFTTSTSVSSEMSNTHEGWYLFSLARAQQGLGQSKKAIENLEKAKAKIKPLYDPELYIRILEELQKGYFKQGEYLPAFNIKQNQREIERQYGFRAFIGAGRLQPKQQGINLAVPRSERQGTVIQEIFASARPKDIDCLIKRIESHDKLTVIYGQSGVGKSSILEAGLIPALKHKAIKTRKVLPVVQKVYTDWIQELDKCLAQSLGKRRNYSSSPFSEASVPTICDQLKKNAENNLLTVLIFDQFEEFFLVCKEPKQREKFYDFLRKCLDISDVKVLLSLREDYLHYLLECNRLKNWEEINGLLDKKTLYYLDNLSSDDATSVIQRLTKQTKFPLDPEMIDRLVDDLARELGGKVRPIELQVVGMQLETKEITKLKQYQKYGSKEKFVNQFLEEVFTDCGEQNEWTAQRVLYLLTDENNTRPLKTRTELLESLGSETENLDLVLKILVNSGLVSCIPEDSPKYYQLVHDYLVTFIRPLVQSCKRDRQILMTAQQQAEQELQKPLLRRQSIQTLLIVFFLFSSYSFGWLQRWELWAFDLTVRFRPKEELDPRLLIVDITENDIKSQKKQSLPDSILYQMLIKLESYQPRLIGLNILNRYRDSPVEPGHTNLANQLVKDNNRIVTVCQKNDHQTPGVPPLVNNPKLFVGFNDIEVDGNGIVRRGLLALSPDSTSSCTPEFSFSFLLALRYLKQQGIEYEVIPQQNQQHIKQYIKLGKVVFSPVLPPINPVLPPIIGYQQADIRGYQIWLNYRSSNLLTRKVTLNDLLKKPINPSWVKDKIVLIGVTAPSNNDSFYTPYSSQLSPDQKITGLMVHGQIVSQILSSVQNERPLINTLPELGQWIWILCWFGLGNFLHWKFWKWRFLKIWLPLSMAVIFLICIYYFAFLSIGLWLPLITPILTLLGSGIIIKIKDRDTSEKLLFNKTFDQIYKNRNLSSEEDGYSIRLTVKYLYSSTTQKEFAARVLVGVALDVLKSCQTSEDIKKVANQLAWVPSPLLKAPDSSLPQFLEISQGVQEATLSDTPLEQKRKLLDSSKSTLDDLSKGLTFAKDRQARTSRSIAKRWLTILDKMRPK